MEGEHRDFEAKRHENQARAQQHQRGGRAHACRQGREDTVQASGASTAVDERRAVNKKRAAERTQDEVLHPGLFALEFDSLQLIFGFVLVTERRHHVQRDAEQFQRHEDHHKVIGAGHEHRACCCEQNQRVELTAFCTDALQVVHAE